MTENQFRDIMKSLRLISVFLSVIIGLMFAGFVLHY